MRSILKIIMTLLIAGGLTHGSHGQSFSSFIGYLVSLPVEDRAAAVDSFMNVITPLGIPYINDDTANFIYLGSAAQVNVAGDFNNWTPQPDPFAKVEGTTFWYRTKIFELNARLDYKLVINSSNWILDPLNPNQVSGGYGPNSELAMPGYIQPWEIGTYPGTDQGTLLDDTFFSTIMNRNYQLKIYLPYGYDANRPQGYPTAYFQDGSEYATLGSSPRVFDNLADSGLICPVIGVFVKPTNRNEEYAGSLKDMYQDFFATELVPYIDGLYHTIKDPKGRAVIGPSFGGNISALISYHHSDLFANCGLHSAAFWPDDYATYNEIVNGEVKPVRYVSIWGTYESLFTNMRSFRDEMQAKGYDLVWMELPEGHSWGQWRATTDEILRYFFPPEFMDVEETLPSSVDYFEVEVSPNPFRESCQISFNRPSSGDWRIKVTDLAGHVILESDEGLVNGNRIVVRIEESGLSDSVYIYRITTGDASAGGKLIRMR